MKNESELTQENELTKGWKPKMCRIKYSQTANRSIPTKPASKICTEARSHAESENGTSRSVERKRIGRDAEH